MSDYQPQVIGFLCNWCSYAASDTAGGKRAHHPAGFNIVRVMCSGRIEPQLVLKAFAEGADGVMILGCHPGDCHYQEGNHKAMRRYEALRQMLGQICVDSSRLRLEWVSAAEADRFVDVVNGFCDELRALGPRGGRTQAKGDEVSA